MLEGSFPSLLAQGQAQARDGPSLSRPVVAREVLTVDIAEAARELTLNRRAGLNAASKGADVPEYTMASVIGRP